MRICEVEDCSRKHYGRGLCQHHYNRANYAPRQRPTLLERLQARSHAEGECMLWDGPIRRSGYGQVSFKGAPYDVHRAAHLARYGTPPEDRPFVLHSCDRRTCWADAHLRWGTHLENMEDARRRQRFLPNHANAHKETCPEGHPYDKVDARGFRVCLICKRRRARAWAAKARRRKRTSARGRRTPAPGR